MLMPLLAWVIALATLAGAAQELRRLRPASDARAALVPVPQFKMKSQALNLADYRAVQKKTVVFGTVHILASPDALSITAHALSDYAGWRLTIDLVLLDNPGVIWRIDSLCSGQCASGEAHKAVLLGSRVSAELETKTEQNVVSGPVVSGSP